jgi:hypothetical protein
MLKFNGTNRRSPLESAKVAKNKLIMECKQTGKTCCEYAKDPKQTERVTPKGKFRRTRIICPGQRRLLRISRQEWGRAPWHLSRLAWNLAFPVPAEKGLVRNVG